MNVPAPQPGGGAMICPHCGQVITLALAEAPALVALGHGVIDALASKSQIAVDRATVDAADLAADALERAKFGA